jgi:hypothetical protein
MLASSPTATPATPIEMNKKNKHINLTNLKSLKKPDNNNYDNKHLLVITILLLSYIILRDFSLILS